jgi:hypothetical protein
LNAYFSGSIPVRKLLVVNQLTKITRASISEISSRIILIGIALSLIDQMLFHLCRMDCIHRADISTGTAIGAQVRIDGVKILSG